MSVLLYFLAWTRRAISNTFFAFAQQQKHQHSMLVYLFTMSAGTFWPIFSPEEGNQSFGLGALARKC